MPREEPFTRIEYLLRHATAPEVRDAGALAERDRAIRELQHLHKSIMIEVEKVAEAQQPQGGELGAMLETVDRIVRNNAEKSHAPMSFHKSTSK